MRLGCCGSPDQAQAFKDAGFDFLEVNVQSVLRGDEPDEKWSPGGLAPGALALPIEAANCLVPSHHPIVGPQRDLKVLSLYMARVAKRAKRLGIAVLVFGSGGARRRPDDVAPEVAASHLAEFTRLAGEACGQHGLTLVIEHLHRSETNTINKLDEARVLADQVNLPSVKVLVDSYHYGRENENDSAITALGSRVAHVHVAEPVDRVQPGGHGPAAPQSFDFVRFFRVLRRTGYAGRVSIECKWNGELGQAGPAAVRLLRQAWDAAGKP